MGRLILYIVIGVLIFIWIVIRDSPSGMQDRSEYGRDSADDDDPGNRWI